ncbi:MAG: succinate dehydrogenase/fumarate reductase flavoprotein subunit, partial [Alphaproteobacteria bacterium]|nr:succinate dehydrogenase/fumarate reductase flavoprotein subunit [Alphaproteobacteria bacterium]
SGLSGQERVFNLSWHDWLNLDSLMLVSRAITLSAIARENSRGAHFRDDFPEPGDLATSAYTVMNLKDGKMEVKTRPVDFVRVRPGESLIDDAA